MGRRKNVVYSRVLDVGDVRRIKALAAENAGLQADLLTQFVPQALKKAEMAVKHSVLDLMIRDLQFYPPRQLGMKVRWKSERQRRKVLYLLRKQAEARLGRKLKPGESIAYRRTLKMRQGWTYRTKLDIGKQRLRIEVENTAETYDPKKGRVRYSRFVTGDIGLGTSRQSLQRYRAPIQPFHTDRGWQPSAPIVQKRFLEAGSTASLSMQVVLEHMARKRFHAK